MSKRFLVTLLAVAVLMTVQPVKAQTDALTQVENQIVAAWGALDGMLATVTVQFEVRTGEMTLPAEFKGRVEYMKGAQAGLFRNELNGQVSIPLEGTSAAMPVNLLTVFDGNTAHTMSTILFETIVVNYQPPEKELGLAGGALFKALHEHCTLRLLADNTVKGIPAYVIEAAVKKPPKDTPMAPGKFVLCFAKDSGILLGVTATDVAGRGIGRMELGNIKINPSLSMSRFQFTPPPGAKIINGDDVGLSDFLPGI